MFINISQSDRWNNISRRFLAVFIYDRLQSSHSPKHRRSVFASDVPTDDEIEIFSRNVDLLNSQLNPKPEVYSETASLEKLESGVIEIKLESGE